MEKVRPWCGQPSDRGRLKIRSAALLRVARVTAGLAESNGSRVYDSLHLQADSQEPGSAPEPYARPSSMGYLYFFQ